MSVTLSSLPGKFKCSLLNVFFFFFCLDGITPNSGLTGPNNIYTYIYTYIYILVSKVGDRSQRRPEGFLFISFNAVV